jgi:transcriptional regulator with XRE-family HTH domain
MSQIGEELRRLRLHRGVTLRDVEKATKISNAYLSQLENGKTDQPSPRVLHKLAEFYKVPYEALMGVAGYLRPTQNGQNNAGTPLHTALMSAELTNEEAQMVSRFVEFLRKEREAS